MNLRAHEQNCGHADFQPEVQVQNIVKTLESLAEVSHRWEVWNLISLFFVFGTLCGAWIFTARNSKLWISELELQQNFKLHRCIERDQHLESPSWNPTVGLLELFQLCTAYHLSSALKPFQCWELFDVRISREIHRQRRLISIRSCHFIEMISDQFLSFASWSYETGGLVAKKTRKNFATVANGPLTTVWRNTWKTNHLN